MKLNLVDVNTAPVLDRVPLRKIAEVPEYVQQLILEQEGRAVVYMLECPRGKQYIGQTIDLKRRYQKYGHNTNSVGKYLSRALTLFGGINNFKLTVLESIPTYQPVDVLKAHLDTREQFFIEKHGTMGGGYNLTGGGMGSFKREVTEETRKKLSMVAIAKSREDLVLAGCSSCGSGFYILPSQLNLRLKKNTSGLVYCSLCVRKSKK